MPTFLELVPRVDALAKFLNSIPDPTPTIERLDTTAALGRILLETVHAPEPLPAFSRSTVDGFAVRAADTYGASESLPAYLTVVGEVPMGQEPGFQILPQTVGVIHTGGMLPAGADAVVMVEDTQLSRTGEVEILKPVASGDNTIEAGEDVRTGDVVLQKGIRLGPAEIGGLLALGILTVSVARPPRVGILSSGDEVVDPANRPGFGQVRDINSHSLRALVQQHGGDPVLYGVVPDSLDVFQSRMRQAFEDCDMVIVTAGSSASTRDLTSQVIQTLGVPGVLVHGVRIRPGKPTILAVCAGKPVIGLPGNPVSALVIAGQFVIPAMERIMGRTQPAYRPRVAAVLSANVPSVAGREDFIPVRLEETDQGLMAHPIFFKSNMIFTLAQSDGLLYIPADAVGLEAGSMVTIYLAL